MPGVGLLDHMVVLFLVFSGTSTLCSKQLYQLAHSQQECGRVTFSSLPFQYLLLIDFFFSDGHSDWSEVWYLIVVGLLSNKKKCSIDTCIYMHKPKKKIILRERNQLKKTIQCIISFIGNLQKEQKYKRQNKGQVIAWAQVLTSMNYTLIQSRSETINQ